MKHHRLYGLQKMSKQAILICTSLILTGFMGAVHFAKAEPDTTPMELRNIALSTNSIDVQNGTVQVIITADIYDDLSGYGKVEFYYTSPSGKIVYEGEQGFGDADGEIFRGTVDFKQNTEAGVWKPTFTLSDGSGNKSVFTSSTFQAAGTDMDITVTSPNQDTVAPTVASVTQDHASILLDNGNPQSVTTTIQVADNAPGQGEVYAYYLSPSGQKITVNEGELYNATTHQTSSTKIWSPYSQGGTWQLYITVCDFVRNCTSYTPGDLAAASLVHSLQVTSTEPDTTPLDIAVLDGKSNDPTFDLVFPGGAVLSAHIEFKPDLSGVAEASITYHSFNGAEESLTLPLAISTATGLYYVNSTLPPYALSGLWTPTLYTRDNAGNEKTYSHTELLAKGFDLSFTFGQSLVEQVADNGTVTTDQSGTGATLTEPLQTSVTAPFGGSVSITSVEPSVTGGTSAGYKLVGQQVSISAPSALQSNPLRLTFTLDASKLSLGQNASNVAIFRNSALVEECPGSTVAIPSPCVTSRTTLPGGDIVITVLTVEASVWALGFAEPESTLFEGFLKPFKEVPSLNKSEAGDTETIKFSFGTNSDISVLPLSSITSQQIDCNTKSVIGSELVVNTNGDGLRLNDHRYKFNWKTLKSWKNTCRQLNLAFSNGETAKAYFTFKKDN